uniref:Uncharacterized protein n=1 Tax=Strongyloides papillosus TaxID=174720 RepID=A0A0N5C016_STREA
MFLPLIDVGYDCDKYSEGVGTSDDGRISRQYLIIKSDNKIMCLSGDILDSSDLIVSVLLSDYNYESNSNVFDIFNKSKIYSGQRFHVRRMVFFNSEIIVDDSIGEKSGYLHRFDTYWTVPNINATLRLKIDGIVQKHKNKIEDNFESIDTYLIDKRKIDNGLVGCHAVPDDVKLPLFEDFYEKRYQTHLLMLNEKTNEYTKVYDINSLVSNKKYKCILNVNSSISDIGILNYILESEFTIQFVDSSFTIWVIFGVSIGIISLLIIDLIIFKKSKLRKKKSNNSSSISTSISSSESTTKHSTIITGVANVPIIQKNNVNNGFKNHVKKILSKDISSHMKEVPKKQ